VLGENRCRPRLHTAYLAVGAAQPEVEIELAPLALRALPLLQARREIVRMDDYPPPLAEEADRDCIRYADDLLRTGQRAKCGANDVIGNVSEWVASGHGFRPSTSPPRRRRCASRA
jgi:hypothetical protein